MWQHFHGSQHSQGFTRVRWIAQTTKIPMIDPVVEQRKADYIEFLYKKSGRTNGLYTNLFTDRVKELVELDKSATIGPLER